MNRKHFIFIFLIFMFSFPLWVLSTEPVRFKLLNLAIKNDKPEMALEVYNKILRKREVLKKFNSILIDKKKDFIKEFEKDIKIYCAQWIKGLFNEAIENYKKKDFKNALFYYNYSISKLNVLLHYLDKQEILNLCDITLDEIQPLEKEHIYKLFLLALRAQDRDLENLKGVNLLMNPRLFNHINDDIPDGYSFSTLEDGVGILKCEVLTDTDDNVNIYHTTQKNRASWFALYFHLGRVPNNTSFVFTIEIKEVNALYFNLPIIYTTNDKSPRWGLGTAFEKRLDSEFLDNGWRREFYVLKTTEDQNVFLHGWIASWGNPRAEGDVYVRKPKVEIGKEATIWTDYLENPETNKL